MERNRGPWIQTFLGNKFYFLEPEKSHISSRDITHSLSNLCRYTGHCIRPYTVAEHCILLSYNVPDKYKQWALLHDAAEAYIGDISGPLKQTIKLVSPIISNLEERILKHIANQLDLEWPISQEVIDADHSILYIEQKYIFSTNIPWEGYSTKGLITDKITPLFYTPYEAEAVFEQRWKELGIKWIK